MKKSAGSEIEGPSKSKKLSSIIFDVQFLTLQRSRKKAKTVI
jgi:hypothetical protein